MCFGSGRHCSIISGSENSGPLSVSITENSFRNSSGPASDQSMLKMRVHVWADLLSRRNMSMRPPGRIIVKRTLPPTRPTTVSSSVHSVISFTRQNSRNIL